MALNNGHHQAVAGAGGDTVWGTACMPPLVLQAPAAGGGGGAKAINLDTAANILRDALKWLYTNRRYLCLVEYTIHDLKAAARQLGYALLQVDGNIRDARSLGWLPFPPAEGWVRDGELLMCCAGQVVLRFDELAVPNTVFHWDPCYATSRCVLNFDAEMFRKRIKRHLQLGESRRYLSQHFEDVAMDPKKRAIVHSHGSSLSLLLPSADEMLALDLKKKSFAAIYSDKSSDKTSSYRSVPADQSPGITLQRQVPVITACHEKIHLSTFPEVRAVPGSQNRQKFHVLVRVKAPVYTQQARAPIDLVMVLDMSITMANGMQHLKQGAKFAILNLRDEDRLSVVTHGPREEELCIFTHMSDQHKRLAIEAVESLEVKSRVHISHGLKKAYEVLCTRSEKNRIGGILLLSDGKDKQILKECQANITRKSLEASDTDIAQRRQFPTYTFGFGTDHDPRTLYYLAREGYGTYSFVNEGSRKNMEGNEGSRNMEDAMALCIGGLTSIVSQDVEITIEAAHPEVKISEIKSGLHKDHFIRESRCSRIQIKDLYGGEEKNFLVCVNVPEEEGHSVATETSLLTVKAKYRNPLTNTNEMMIKVDEAKVFVERPPTPTTAMMADQDDSSMSPEVETEMYRVEVLDRVLSIWNGIATASHHWTYVLEAGVKYWGVRDVDKDGFLDQLNKLLGEIDPTANPSCNPDMAALRRKLYNDINKMRDGMAEDVAAGLPYMLSWLSSHGWQRAATRVVASDSSFLTVRMHNMIASVETALAK